MEEEGEPHLAQAVPIGGRAARAGGAGGRRRVVVILSLYPAGGPLYLSLYVPAIATIGTAARAYGPPSAYGPAGLGYVLCASGSMRLIRTVPTIVSLSRSSSAVLPSIRKAMSTTIRRTYPSTSFTT